MAEFLMPSLGADMDEGTLLEWLVKPGDQIRKGDIIAVVDTAKSAIEVESFHAGTIERLVVEPGQTVPVGTVLAVIGEAAEGEAPAAPAEPQAAEPQAVGPAVAEPAAARRPARKTRPGKAPPGKRAVRPRPPPRPAAGEPHPAAAGSPLVRHLAHQLGVDLAAVQGTGPAGTVTRADVERVAAAARPASARPAPAQEGPLPQAPVPAPAPAPRRRVSPRARRVAEQLGVRVSEITGTGPDGAVREADVRRAAPAQAATLRPSQAEEHAPAVAAASPRERAQAMRLAIARLMARSKREIPHYYLSNTVDMTAALGWLHERNRELAISDRLVPAALLLKAAALAARQVPDLNGYWEDDHFTPAGAVHLGVPISLRGGGLLTPAIRDAADLPPGELMARLRDLVIRARAGRLRRAELADATITVTNLGDQGVEAVFGVIFPPQVALVGIGKVTEQPVAVNGLIGARPVVVTTLSADHRASDGYTGARYLAALSDLLQRPEEL